MSEGNNVLSERSKNILVVEQYNLLKDEVLSATIIRKFKHYDN